MTAQQLARQPHAPLFKSVHSALMFAYTFSENQRARAAAGEALMQQFAKERYEKDAGEVIRVLIEPRGLIGLDGATQSGMIQSAVARLPVAAKAAIWARFDIMQHDNLVTKRKHYSRRRLLAWQTMAIYAGTKLAIDTDRAQYAVQACYGQAVRAHVVENSEAYLQVKRSQAFDMLKRVREFIRMAEQRGYDALEPQFRAGGVIE